MRVENHGTLVLIYPTFATERTWLNENIAEDATWFGGALVVEPRYVEDIVAALTAFCGGVGTLPCPECEDDPRGVAFDGVAAYGPACAGYRPCETCGNGDR
jgi:hypothetical protein